MSDHERHTENVGAYLLGALPELEAEAFERHVMGCASCRDELERLRPGAEALPRSVPQYNPPPELKRSVMAEVRQEAVARAPRTRRLRLPARPRLRPAMAWVSAAVVLAGAVVGFGASTLVGDDGDVRTVTAAVDHVRAPGGSGRLIIPEGGDVAVLDVHGLRRTAGAEVYVVWVQRAGQPIFESSFDVRPDGSGKAAIDGIEGVERVMVTKERSPDVAAPTDQPVLSVPLG